MRFTLFDIWKLSKKSWGLRIASIITWGGTSSLFSIVRSEKGGVEFDFLYLSKLVRLLSGVK